MCLVCISVAAVEAGGWDLGGKKTRKKFLMFSTRFSSVAEVELGMDP